MQAARKRLAFVTVIFWLLLAYIMAALIWWFISLEQQNNQMMQLRLSEISRTDVAYTQKAAVIRQIQQRKHAQYVGEGIIFMMLIILGAVIVFRGTRRYLLLGQQQQNFMMAVTHELKTPISVARLNTETLLKHKLDVTHQQRLLQLTLSETDRLNDLCNNILLASRFDSGAVSQHREPLNFSQLVTNTVEHFATLFSDRKIAASVEPEIHLTGDPLLLNILVNNLVENAFKYAGSNKTVQVKLSKSESSVKLVVADEGAGIPLPERKKVFEKFYRIGDEKTRSQKGTGLGLYLVKKIVVDQGGTIEIEDNQPQGTIFVVRLPNEKRQNS